MFWTRQRLWLLAFGLALCWLLDPTLLPLLAGVGAFEMGCGCGCEESAACEVCCTGGIAQSISISIGEVFENCDPADCDLCDTWNNVDVFLDEGEECNWTLLDFDVQCSEFSNPYFIQYSLDLFKPEDGDCQVTFIMYASSGPLDIPIFIVWYAEFTETDDCTTISLPHTETYETGGACCVVDAIPNITVNWNP